MADSKISALSAITSLAATDELVVASAGASVKISAAHLPGFEFDYVERTTRLDISATTAAGANTVIDGNAVTYDGSTRIKVEFVASFASSSQFISVDLWDGSTDLGVIAQLNAGGNGAPIYGVLFLTPSAASHTFHIKAWRGTGSAAFETGAGGAGTRTPAILRITRA
jgi:hypothetical protein